MYFIILFFAVLGMFLLLRNWQEQQDEQFLYALLSTVKPQPLVRRGWRRTKFKLAILSFVMIGVVFLIHSKDPIELLFEFSLYCLGFILLKKPFSSLVMWHIRAKAEQGDTESQAILGWVDGYNRESTPIFGLSLFWVFLNTFFLIASLFRMPFFYLLMMVLRKKARKGSIMSQVLICKKSKNTSEIKEWSRKVAEQLDAGTKAPFGFILGGPDLPNHSKKAMESLREAADKGVADAQFELGKVYWSVRGIYDNDYGKTIEWMRKAAEQGHAVAQYCLGYLYLENELDGLVGDDREAVKWFLKAAEQGDISSQLALGVMYNQGRGVPKDDQEAIGWLHKAANQGDEIAKALLQLLMEKHNTLQDLIPVGYPHQDSPPPVSGSRILSDQPPRRKTMIIKWIVAVFCVTGMLLATHRYVQDGHMKLVPSVLSTAGRGDMKDDVDAVEARETTKQNNPGSANISNSLRLTYRLSKRKR